MLLDDCRLYYQELSATLLWRIDERTRRPGEDKIALALGSASPETIRTAISTPSCAAYAPSPLQIMNQNRRVRGGPGGR